MDDDGLLYGLKVIGAIIAIISGLMFIGGMLKRPIPFPPDYGSISRAPLPPPPPVYEAPPPVFEWPQTTAPSQPRSADSVEFRIQNMSGSSIEIAFYADGGQYVWPSADRVYILSNGAENTYDLKCNYVGQQVCYGASVGTRYWGTGIGNQNSCTSCCLKCNGGSSSWTLN